MKRGVLRPTVSIAAWMIVLVAGFAPIRGHAQTEIALRKNKYSPGDDVQLGRQAAAEIEKKLRLVRDPEASDYLQRVGNRLVEAVPERFQHSEFNYYFKVVDAKEINAFALPGGPMYVHTGMIVAAKREGEMAGVMAHEIAHVALRHGTAQATKAAPYQTLGALGQIGGAILGGTLGGVIGQGSQLGVGVYLLKFSREYETEADILGAQILARAGYDPRDLAAMFKTIEAQGGGGGPAFLSSHPNPENRYQRIEQEARLLKVTGEAPDAREFARIRSQIVEDTSRYSRDNRADNRNADRRESDISGARIGRVELPSSRLRSYSDNSLFRISIPENWRDIPGQDAVWFAPEGGYGEAQGRAIFTHGVNVGVIQSQVQDLRRGTSQFISELQRQNERLRQRTAPKVETLAGRNAYYTSFSNVSEATGNPEAVELYTIQLRSGELFYLITVVPQGESQNYERLFQRIAASLELRD